jgi:hypothetical protein
MTNKAKLLHQLSQLKRDDRALKTEELNIQRTTAARGQQESLASNHEKRMKNKRQQRRITGELRAMVPVAPIVIGQAVAQVANAVPLVLPQRSTPVI